MMAGTYLTDRLIKCTHCDTGRLELRDSIVPGFGIRISAHHKSFFLVFRSPTAQTRDGQPLRRRVSLGDYPKQRLASARAEAAQILDQVSEGIDPFHDADAEKVTVPTFERLALDYLERYAKRRKVSWYDDRSMINKLLHEWGARPADSITSREVRRVLEGYSDKTPVYANRIHSVLRSVFQWGIRQGDLESNPARMVEKLNPELPRDRVLVSQEIRKLWSLWSASSHPAAAVLQLRLLTGQRGKQISKLNTSNLDARDEGLWWNVPALQTKTKRPYRVFLAPAATNILRQVGPHPSGHWFGSTAGTRAYETRLRVAGQRLSAKSGVTHWQPRDLRRTAATLMAERGVSRFIIKRVLGHVDSEVTAVYDLYSYDREVKEAALVLESAVRDIVGQPDC